MKPQASRRASHKSGMFDSSTSLSLMAAWLQPISSADNTPSRGKSRSGARRGRTGAGVLPGIADLYAIRRPVATFAVRNIVEELDLVVAGLRQCDLNRP